MCFDLRCTTDDLYRQGQCIACSMLFGYLARVVARGIKPMAVKTHRNSVYARPGRWARVTTMPAMKAPRHMSPVVCKFDITSVLVCLSCKAQTEFVRVDLLHHSQWVLTEAKAMQVNHSTCYVPYKVSVH